MEHYNMASERVRVGLTQEKMARELGINVSTLARYEKSTDSIPPSILKAASEYFGCTTDYLLDMTPERVKAIS